MEETTNTFPLRGEVSVQAFNLDGSPRWQATKKNVITNVGKMTVALLLAGQGAGRNISRIGFGTSGAGAVATNTGLSSDAFFKNVTAVNVSSNAADPYVEFVWRLEASEANGLTLREFGLFNQGSVIFSRLVRDPVVKDSTFYLTGTWRITL